MWEKRNNKMNKGKMHLTNYKVLYQKLYNTKNEHYLSFEHKNKIKDNNFIFLFLSLKSFLHLLLLLNKFDTNKIHICIILLNSPEVYFISGLFNLYAEKNLIYINIMLNSFININTSFYIFYKFFCFNKIELRNYTYKLSSDTIKNPKSRKGKISFVICFMNESIIDGSGVPRTQ